MKNRKLKGKYGIVNLQLHEMSKLNFITISKCMLCLNKQGVSKRKLAEMYDEYTASWVEKYNQLARDDVMHEFVCRDLNAIGLEHKELYKHTDFGNITGPEQREAIVDNLGIFCLYLNRKIRYGKKRLRGILEMMDKYSGDPAADIKRLIGIEVEEVLPDVRERIGKKEKTDIPELREMMRDMEGLRAMQGRSKQE